jgi:hypothetical protein
MSAGKSPKRRAQPRPIRFYRRMDARNRAELRACCLTSIREPHLPDCERGHKCRDKVGFTDRDSAIRRARELEATLGRMTVYRCRQGCGAIHLGHPRTLEEGL